jgi:hypothetical protein
MNVDFERTGGIETITLSRQPTPVAVVVSAMGLLLILQVGVVLLTRTLPIPLMGLLVIAAISAGWLSLIALESLLATTVRMDKDGLTVCRLLGDVTVPWLDFGGAKLIPSVGMLSDDPSAAASGRLAVGLFVKSRKEPRAHELDADIVVYGASEAHATSLLRLVDRIDGFKSTIGAGLGDPTRRIRKAAPIAQPTAFRRQRQVG